MILSNTAIQEASDSGDIVIHPEPCRKPNINQAESPFATSAVDLRLSDALSIPRKGKPFNFDLRLGGLAPFLAEVCEPVRIDSSGGYALQPHTFVLGNTIEHVDLPIRSERPAYAARVEGKSSRARCGLLVHFTAPTIHAGFQGTVTLEIINLGAYPITLYPGMSICQLIFEEVKGVPVAAPSQFQGQNTPAGIRKSDPRL
jgi:dCTP deaminase